MSRVTIVITVEQRTMLLCERTRLTGAPVVSIDTGRVAKVAKFHRAFLNMLRVTPEFDYRVPKGEWTISAARREDVAYDNRINYYFTLSN